MSSPSSARRRTGATSPSSAIADALDALPEIRRPRCSAARRRCVRRFHRTVHPARPPLGFPARPRHVDQHLRAQVRPRLSRGRLGRVARPRGAPRRAHLRGELPRWQHADLRAQLLAFGLQRDRAVLPVHPARGSRGIAAYSRRARTPRCTSPRASRRSGHSSCSRRQRAARLRLHRRPGRPATACTTSPTRCASVAGRCPPTRCVPTSRASPCCASSSATDSRATCRSSSSTTSSARWPSSDITPPASNRTRTASGSTLTAQAGRRAMRAFLDGVRPETTRVTPSSSFVQVTSTSFAARSID